MRIRKVFGVRKKKKSEAMGEKSAEGRGSRYVICYEIGPGRDRGCGKWLKDLAWLAQAEGSVWQREDIGGRMVMGEEDMEL
jgi:hypothetical protein